MEEIIVNLHMHTHYSDGSGSHLDIARAAIRSGLDAVLVSDHNVLVRGFEGYFNNDSRHVLMLIGEELHDQARDPQKNHLLVFGADQEMASYTSSPQSLIKNVKDSGGISFIAHPDDAEAKTFNEPAISWEDWAFDGYTGLELWNGLSELKTLIPTKLHGVFYFLFPALVAHRPSLVTLKKWDEQLGHRRVVAVGGSDAHALRLRFGPLKGIVFPYDFHFRTINTHVFIDRPLSGDVISDKKMIYEALGSGHCFIGYDLPKSTRGFRFISHGSEINGIMGDEIPCRGGVTLEAHLPSFAEIRLLKNGEVILKKNRSQAFTYFTREPGVYRVEAFIKYFGIKRGWIFSNPIYVI